MTTTEEARDRLGRRAEAMENERDEWRQRAWTAEAELARIERELLAALASDQAKYPEGPKAQGRLYLLTALRIVQGDRFGVPTADHAAVSGVR
jgi:hypothetical protein